MLLCRMHYSLSVEERDLEGLSVLVTGATSGIGRAAARPERRTQIPTLGLAGAMLQKARHLGGLVLPLATRLRLAATLFPGAKRS